MSKAKLHLENAIIEITRKCNLECDHCLRGDAQCLDIPDEYIVEFLQNVTYIDFLTISGGEPTLNMHGLRLVLDELTRRQITVDYIYIVVNGTNLPVDFISLMQEYYQYPYQAGDYSDDDMSFLTVQCSNDKWHNEEIERLDLQEKQIDNINRLSFMKCFNVQDYTDNINHIIAEGRGKNISPNGKVFLMHEFSYNEMDDVLWVEGEVYLNCKGNIISGCDWSYDKQDNLYRCSVADMLDYFNAKNLTKEVVYA